MTAEPRSPCTCSRTESPGYAAVVAWMHGQRAGLEPHGGDGDVLDLDALVGEQGGLREDLDGPAEEPDQQVDGVHALVHHRAAAVELPGAAPLAGVVVVLAAPPGDRRDAAGEPAERAVVSGLARPRPTTGRTGAG